MKNIILTGDRPTGKLHIGHYVGSLRRRVELQNSGKYDEMYIMIADAQALTDNAENPDKIRDNLLQVALDYLSVGIDPSKTTIFVQSAIPALTELNMYYNKKYPKLCILCEKNNIDGTKSLINMELCQLLIQKSIGNANTKQINILTDTHNYCINMVLNGIYLSDDLTNLYLNSFSDQTSEEQKNNKILLQDIRELYENYRRPNSELMMVKPKISNISKSIHDKNIQKFIKIDIQYMDKKVDVIPIFIADDVMIQRINDLLNFVSKTKDEIKAECDKRIKDHIIGKNEYTSDSIDELIRRLKA